ncbi:MAG: archaemetzincin [Phycisphaerae bacterium]
MSKQVAAVCAAVAAAVLVTIGFSMADKPTTSPAGPASQPAGLSVAELNDMIRKLEPLHTRLGKPQPGDWLESHREPGQSFAQYIDSKPTVPQGRRSIIYIQPLGEFTPAQRKIVNRTADYMGRYFGLEVKIKDDLELAIIPDSARRKHPQWGDKQILTGYVLNKVLKPLLPQDAAAYIAFTASDLWPGEGWNFVFGEASLAERVGVWSICRNGEPEKSEADFRLCLLRTMKTATHETGHMFGMYHCTAYECNMCGSNNRDEADRRPIALCPQCTAKLCWATRAEPIVRFRRLAEFCRANGLTAEAEFDEKSIKALGGQVTTSTGPAR